MLIKRKLNCGVPQGSILGSLLFTLYIKNITACCKFTKIILFADDTTISSIGCKPEDIETDLNEIGCWLLANKLSLNLDKTVQLNLSARASNHQYSMNNCPVIIKQRCKYLGLNFDSKLTFKFHIDFVKKRLGKQCGIICKLRHYVPRQFLIRYYKSNINPIIQYGILLYGCTKYSNLEKNYLQNFFLKFIYFRHRGDHCEDIFQRHKILSVFELQICEMLKFVLRSVYQLHSEKYLNDLFSFENKRSTRNDSYNLLHEPLCRKKLEDCHCDFAPQNFIIC